MTDAGTGSAQPRGSSGTLKLVLLASLALNFLIVGALAGAMFLGRKPPWLGGPRGEDFGLLGFARSLPADRRAVIRASLQKQRGQLKPLWMDVHKMREAAGEALVTEPFDRANVKAAFDKIGDAETKLREAGLNIFLDTAEKLTPDERRSLRDWWIKKRGHQFRFRGEGRKPPPPEAEPPPAP